MAASDEPARTVAARSGGRLRPVDDTDADALVDLVGASFAEYDGCVLDLDGLDADLLAPATTAGASGARWWVVTDVAGTVVATIGAGAPAAGLVELKRLYVAAAARRLGLGTALVRLVEAHARGLGAHGVELWSDTRFDAAHRLYGRTGYHATGETRDLDDPSNTTEYRFLRELSPAEPDGTTVWVGPGSRVRLDRFELPDGVHLSATLDAGAAPEATATGTAPPTGPAGPSWQVEVDAAWRARRVDVRVHGRDTRLTSDGRGRWWADAEPRPDLEGCVTVVPDGLPVAAELVVRAAGEGTHRVAILRLPTLRVEPTRQTWTSLGRGRWRCSAREGETDVEVDGDDRVISAGDWRRRGRAGQ